MFLLKMSVLVSRSIKYICPQLAQKVMSDSPGQVDFAIGLVVFVLNLRDTQVLFLGEIQIMEGL